MPLKEPFDWTELTGYTLPADHCTLDDTVVKPDGVVAACGGQLQHTIVAEHRLDTLRHVDRLLEECSKQLEMGGTLVCHAVTSRMKQREIWEKYPRPIAYIAISWHYWWHRACSKMRLTSWFYFLVTQGHNRSMSRVEILGRLYRAGFVVDQESKERKTFIVRCHKVHEPICDAPRNKGALIKLDRVGKNGETIKVYKFRTMFAYSEYIQGYIYDRNQLRDGGKIAHDYRITRLGKLIRSSWIDELPMVLNMLKGELKLVGVRPLSRQYFSLYTPEMQQLRFKVKPGLIPPFYYDRTLPSTLEEIQDNERRYIESYLQHPFRTDWHYIWVIIGNILFHHKRSH